MVTKIMKRFKTFIEIYIGGSTKEEIIKRLYEQNISFNDYGFTLFEHPDFTPSIEIEKVKLVKLSLNELNLNHNCSFEDFVQRASEFNLRLCPLYLAAYLRLEYLEQVEGPYLTIASNKPKGPNLPNGFYLRNFENKLWLRGFKADGFTGWPEDNEFVFIKND